MIISIIIVILSMIAAGFFAGIEIGSYSLNRVRLRFHIESKKYNAALLDKNLKDPQIFIFTTLACCNLCVFIASSMVTALYLKHGIGTDELVFLWDFFPWSSEVAATLTLMFPLLFFSEIIPKNLFRKNADTLMYLTAGIQRFFIIVSLPLTIPQKFISKLLTLGSAKNYNDELQNLNLQKLKFFLSESKREGVISDRESNMINKAMLIHIMPVTDIMIDIEKLIALPENASCQNCLQLIYHNRSLNRVPVFRDRKDNIVGYVHFFDILTSADNKNADIKPYVKHMYSIKWNVSIQQAFYEMQTRKEPIASVVNSKGSIIGVIRLREIVRHITGH